MGSRRTTRENSKRGWGIYQVAASSNGESDAMGEPKGCLDFRKLLKIFNLVEMIYFQQVTIYLAWRRG